MLAVQFLLDEASGDLKALRPLGETEFLVAPRELPQLMSFEARLDSSLRAPLAALPSTCATWLPRALFPSLTYRRVVLRHVKIKIEVFNFLKSFDRANWRQ